MTGHQPAPALPDSSAWTLDPAVAYLNHGGFGAAPASVLARQQELRAELERNPHAFLVRELPGRLDQVRAEVAAFLSADPEGVVFVGNATTGMQTVIAHMRLSPGDEVVLTDHCYGAVRVQLQRAAAAAGAVLRTVPVPLPATDAGSVAETILAGITARTRLVVVDHIASCSGMIFPVARIAAHCRSLGIPVAVDGAHAPGQVRVDLTEVGADFWTGNLHKWVSAPKASAVLYAAPRWRDSLRPLVASEALGDGFRPSFDWTGTHDPTALLSVPAALRFFSDAGWPAVWRHNNELSRAGASVVRERLGTAPVVADELSAALQLVRLPVELTDDQARALGDRLWAERIVVPVTSHAGRRYLRVSAQLYNTIADYERLAAALDAVTD
jgi:isopenicillin-N epimerase